ncbi:MAG: hypothetical protein JWN85_4696 [Gammaproteobacteria bacterium]|nr:hypothetical protein [Gammaproteobacteria bacterium]
MLTRWNIQTRSCAHRADPSWTATHCCLRRCVQHDRVRNGIRIRAARGFRKHRRARPAAWHPFSLMPGAAMQRTSLPLQVTRAGLQGSPPSGRFIRRRSNTLPSACLLPAATGPLSGTLANLAPRAGRTQRQRHAGSAQRAIEIRPCLGETVTSPARAACVRIQHGRMGAVSRSVIFVLNVRRERQTEQRETGH